MPYRNICRDMGAGLTTSEMLTSDTSLWGSEKSRHRLFCEGEDGHPSSIQIAGSDPQMMATAASIVAEKGAQIVDINMGCPAKKVCKKLAGSALLRDERLVAKILSSVVASVDVPVTLKTRTGWNEELRNGPAIARIAENEGIAAIAVHGRTRSCRFKGKAEYDTIAKIVADCSIPVIANGDITSPEKAKYVLDYTGAAATMIGRAVFGNPWIFREISRFIATGVKIEKPRESEVKTVMEAHFRELYNFYGDYRGTRIARKHFAWYCQTHLKDSVAKVKTFNHLETSQSQLDAVHSLFERPFFYEDKAA